MSGTGSFPVVDDAAPRLALYVDLETQNQPNDDLLDAYRRKHEGDTKLALQRRIGDPAFGALLGKFSISDWPSMAFGYAPADPAADPLGSGPDTLTAIENALPVLVYGIRVASAEDATTLRESRPDLFFADPAVAVYDSWCPVSPRRPASSQTEGAPIS